MNFNYIMRNNINALNGKQVYIYGAGEFAHDIAHMLNNNGIDINGFIIDDAYMTKMKGGGRDKLILLSEYKERTSDIVINGIANVKNFRRVCNKNIFSSFYILYEPVLLWDYDSDYFEQNKTKLINTESLFADDESIAVRRAYIEAKRSGGADTDIALASEENIYFNNLTAGKFDGAYIDCGAYNGDSVEKYISWKNDAGQHEIYAFEPDAINFRKMQSNFLNRNNVYCINKGIWKCKSELEFLLQGDMASKCAEGNKSENIVSVTNIDSALNSTKVGFIKMDIEGCELEGLQGAKETIMQYHPVLAISAYHKMQDVIELPQYIKLFEDDEWGYDLFLRHHGICAYELVLYAIPVRRK